MINTLLNGGGADKKSRFTAEQIVFALKQVDLSLDKPMLQDVLTVIDLYTCRCLGICVQQKCQKC